MLNIMKTLNRSKLSKLFKRCKLTCQKHGDLVNFYLQDQIWSESVQTFYLGCFHYCIIILKAEWPQFHISSCFFMFAYTLVKPKVRGITHVILFYLRVSFVCPEPLPPSSFLQKSRDNQILFPSYGWFQRGFNCS